MTGSTSPHIARPDSAAPVMSDRLDALVSGLTAEEAALVSAASSLVPVLSANAETADAMRRLPEEDIKALREAGLFRLATPRAYGGHEAGACAATAIAAELGRGCSSASWVLVVYYTASVTLWLFPDQVRHQVWGQDPDATVCGSSAGAVPARAVQGRGSRVGGTCSAAAEAGPRARTTLPGRSSTSPPGQRGFPPTAASHWS